MNRFPRIPRPAGLAVSLVLLGLIWLFLPSQVAAQPPIPHPLEGRDNCLGCHEQGVAGAPQIPEDHAGRTNDMCLGCHVQAMTETAPHIPHTLEGREDCVACHSPAPEGEETEAQPSVAPVEVPQRIEHPESVGGANTCRDCHMTLGGRNPQIVADWQSSIHAQRGVICSDCHGGDPNAEDLSDAMSITAGFTGKPDRTQIPAVCGSCHADVTLMRQYDLPTDQYAKYLESFHGQRLAEGDTKVATCYDCHDGHATRETNDPRASVYQLNVPALCAGCHADEDYMAEYDIPTNQYALYKESVHGIALLDNQDTRAPSCATCHGTHGAAPPGFEEVANVCGSCHEATQDYYLTGVHSSGDPETPDCVTCHGRYDVSEPSDAMFVGSDPRHCGSCHAPDSEAGKKVEEIHQAIVDADEALQTAESTVERASALGMIVSEEEGLITDARTKLITARAAQHTIDVDTVMEATNNSIQISEQARTQAEDAIAESRFRRQAMIVAVAVIVLVIVSLVMLRRQLAAGRE